LTAKLGYTTTLHGICIWFGEGVTPQTYGRKLGEEIDEAKENVQDDTRSLQEEQIHHAPAYYDDPGFAAARLGDHYTSPEGVTYYVQTAPRTFQPRGPQLYGGRGEHGQPCYSHRDCNSHFTSGPGFRCVRDAALTAKLGYTTTLHGICIWFGEGVTPQLYGHP